MSVNTDCASAIANNPHPQTSASSAIVPTNLRARIDMTTFQTIYCGVARRSVWAAPAPASKTHVRDGVKNSQRSGAAVAADGRRNDRYDAGGRRRDTPDRIRPFDRRVEAGYGRRAAIVGKRMAG